MQPFCPLCKGVNQQLQQKHESEELHRQLLRRIVSVSSAPFVIPGFMLSVPQRCVGQSMRIEVGRTAFWITEQPEVESFITQMTRLVFTLTQSSITNTTTPTDVMKLWNKTLLQLRLEPVVMLGVYFGIADEFGNIAIARAGLPMPVVERDEKKETVTVAGPFLGAFEADYPTAYINLEPHAKLHLAEFQMTRNEPKA